MKVTPNLVSERQFKNDVVAFARALGWLVHHDLPSQRANGSWATATQGDSGFPDLVLVHPGNSVHKATVLYAELKTQRGKTTASQEQWLTALRACGQMAFVWRPTQMGEIYELLYAGMDGYKKDN
jgi:hypothetical protein